jgi:hypothetical protein
MSTERSFRTGQVIPFLKSLKNTFFEPIQQMAIVGSPDFVACINGRFVALELKSKTGKLSPLQMYKLNQITFCNGISLVVSPNNWENVKKTLSDLDNKGRKK